MRRTFVIFLTICIAFSLGGRFVYSPAAWDHGGGEPAHAPEQRLLINHFTVVCLVTWPLNGSEAGVDLVLIQTSLLLLCKSSCSYAN